MPDDTGEQRDTPERVIEDKPADAIVEVNDVGERITRDADNADVAPNYRYWQQHGHAWADEYDERKLFEIKYHIQEWMILDYVRRLSLESPDRPLRVLEYGCGVGRHLANLDKLPNVEVHGFDQSRTMVEGCLRWTSQNWIDTRITIGEPDGALPYDDDSFDLVYTSEVLVHVRPEDVPSRLQEMMRVANRQVLHVEPSEHFKVAPDVHFGCWKHDLVAVYASIGVECELLPSGFFSQAPFRVVLSGDADRYGWCPVALGLMRRMEQDTITGRQARVASARAKEQEDARTSAEAERQKLIDTHKKQQHARKKKLHALEKTIEQLNAQVGESRAALDGARNDTENARKQRDNQQTRVNNLQRTVSELEARLTKAESAKASADRVSAELDAANARLAESSAAIAELERVQSQLRDQIETTEAEAAQRVETAEAERSQMLQELKRQISVSRDTVVQLEHRRQHDRSKIAKAAAQQERFISRIDEILGANR